MGIVYFIKHKNLSPIKIGITTKPLRKRLNQLKVASPYGLEVVGTIQTNEPNLLESIIHKELKSYRLNGEWFDIDNCYANIIIDKHSYKENIKKRFSFDIPFDIDYEKYSEFELKAFVKIFNSLNFNELANEYNLKDILNVSKEQYKVIAYKYNITFNNSPKKPVLKDAIRRSGLSLRSLKQNKN